MENQAITKKDKRKGIGCLVLCGLFIAIVLFSLGSCQGNSEKSKKDYTNLLLIFQGNSYKIGEATFDDVVTEINNNNLLYDASERDYGSEEYCVYVTDPEDKGLVQNVKKDSNGDLYGNGTLYFSIELYFKDDVLSSMSMYDRNINNLKSIHVSGKDKYMYDKGDGLVETNDFNQLLIAVQSFE